MAESKIYINDPAVPELVKTVTMPPHDPQLPYEVGGYVYGQFDQNSSQGRAMQCEVSVGLGIQRFLTARPNKDSVRWPATNVLQVLPERGQKFNAFYDRRALNFFFDMDTVRNKMVYASSSPDIILHELGHAVLDTLHPGLWSYSGLFEVWALHESFGDIFNLVNATTHEEAVQHALDHTQGDLSKNNVISRLAEEFGQAIRKTPTGMQIGLRDAAYWYVYKDPSTLPTTGKQDALFREVHSFSRVFTVATYRLFVMLYNRNKKEGMEPVPAVQKAMDYIALLILGAAPLVAVRPDFFDSYARCMLYIDYTQGQKYTPEIAASYQIHRIIHPTQLKVQNVVEPRHEPDTVTISQGSRRELFRVRSTICPAREGGIRAMSENPLYNLEIDVALDRVRHFDAIGNLTEDTYDDREKAIRSVMTTLDYLHQEKLVGVDEHQPFAIEENRLIRKHFACFPRR